jgi:hypothetical protein
MGKAQNGVPEHGECAVDNATVLAPKTLEITGL